MADIFNNFWLADDGRVFGSTKQLISDDTDSDYVAWTGLGNLPSPWPRDDAGNQTEDALQDAVGPVGLFVNLKYYTVAARYRKEQSGLTLSSGMPIKTDDRAQAKINGAVIASINDAGFTTQWHAADGSYWPLDQAGVAAMSTELQAYINQCFATAKATTDGIDGGTITTRAEVDAAFGAITSTRKKKK
jgi:hypothetical protein